MANYANQFNRNDPWGDMVSISPEHAHIHDGEAYSCVRSNAALGAGASLLVQITVPSTGYYHLKEFNVFTTADTITVDIYEAPTFTTGSSAVTALNRDRNSTNTSSLTLFSDPSGISGGTNLDGRNFGTGGPNGSFAAGSEVEWNLKNSTTYIISVTNEDAGANIVSYELFWYE